MKAYGITKISVRIWGKIKERKKTMCLFSIVLSKEKAFKTSSFLLTVASFLGHFVLIQSGVLLRDLVQFYSGTAASLAL